MIHRRGFGLIRRVVGTLGLIAVGAAGLATGFAQAHPASPQAANATTHITVAASEFKFGFSKRSIPAVGTVIFTVVNKGKISHNFKIGGKTTPNLLSSAPFVPSTPSWSCKDRDARQPRSGCARRRQRAPALCRWAV